LEAYRRALGEEHLHTLGTARALADLYVAAGRVPEAMALLEPAWAKVRKQPGFPVDERTYMSGTLGKAYERAGQFAEAESLYRDALEAVRQRHKEASPPSTALQVYIAYTLVKQQRYAEAEPLLRECLRFRKQYEPGEWTTFATKSLLGGSLLGQKKYAEAEPLLLAGYEGMKQREREIPTVVKVRLTEAIERLVQLYEAWGKPEKAAEWRAKLPPTAAELPADVFARP
jgi:tetratricopeptide (TPR) repeat protein